MATGLVNPDELGAKLFQRAARAVRPYTRLSAFLLASDGDAEILRIASRPYMLTLRSNNEFEPLLRTVRSRVFDLRLNRIQLASPGFVELLGSLNPIKAIADFITAWRHENTLRALNTLEHKRALAERAAEIVKSAPSPDFVDRFLRFALEEPNEQLTVIARCSAGNTSHGNSSTIPWMERIMR